jgi:alkylation response protein AidB-like acyl-CoA dehydrogenase
VWSSFAHEARFGMLLARTDPEVPKHEGISYFLLDLLLPGVEVRPLRQITGDTEFNEVFLDDVTVPDSARLGPEGQGWSVAMTTLMNERSTISGSGSGFGDRFGGRSIERIIDLARRPAGPGVAPVSDDPVMRDRIVQMWIESRLLSWTNQRVRAARRAGREVGAEGSIGKLLHSEHNLRLQELAIAVLGARSGAHLESDSDAASVVYGFLRSRSETIAGGTSQVQRNILGERVLGLPREPAADRDMPWKDIPRGR